MKKCLSTIILAGVAASVPALANAQTPEGPYVAVHGGVNFSHDRTLSGTVPGFGWDKGSVDTSVGYAVGGAMGYSFGDVGWVGAPRLEIEATWRSNNIKGWKSSGYRYGGLDNLDSLAIMVNGLFEFDTGTDFYPYLGAGIGAVVGWLGTSSPLSDVDDTAFGYQGIAGVGYNLTDNVGVTLDYRFLGTTSWKDSGLKYESYLNHTVMLGLRYAFGTPQPAPVVVEEVVAVPDSYLVFFDFDKSTITPEASGIISTAASNARTQQTTMIEVTGHTDKSGSAEYNQGLSLRRAEAVTVELERNGIPRSQVAVYAKGESEPLVPTEDGVREPQNRRVVIVLR